MDIKKFWRILELGLRKIKKQFGFFNVQKSNRKSM